MRPNTEGARRGGLVNKQMTQNMGLALSYRMKVQLVKQQNRTMTENLEIIEQALLS